MVTARSRVSASRPPSARHSSAAGRSSVRTASSTLLGATAAKLRKFSGSWSDVLGRGTTTALVFRAVRRQHHLRQRRPAREIRADHRDCSGDCNVPDQRNRRGDGQGLRDVPDRRFARRCGRQFNDSTGWTFGTNQSDYQPLLTGGRAFGSSAANTASSFRRTRSAA
jgi:hypothetical protein